MEKEADSSQRFDSTFWLITGALTALLFSTALMNLVVFPQFDAIYTYARDISVTANALFLLLIGAVATFRPRWLQPRAFMVFVAVSLIGGMVALLAALQVGDALFLSIAASVAAVGRAGVTVLTGLAAARFDLRKASVCVAVAFSASCLLKAVAWIIPIWLGLLLFLLLPMVALACIARLSTPLLQRTARAEAPASVAITRPSSFLPLAGQLFVCLFLFSVAFGFSLRFGEVGGVPVSDFLVVVPVVLLAVHVLVSKHPVPSDLVAEIAVVLVVAGFIFVSMDASHLSTVSNVLLSAGNTLFDLVAWTVLIAVAHRNPLGALAVFAWGRGVSGLGTLVGAALGVWCNDLFANDHTALALVSGGLIVLFVAYALIGLKNFSFKSTIEGVVPVSDAVATNAQEDFDERCAACAAEFDLTPRELEIFKMLARGRDREYIENRLVISRNTVKAHVKHIYAKCGIHSHVELIALVQET